MNSKPHFTYSSSKSAHCLVAALALALTVPARAETPPHAIPFADIGARATANYDGDALGISATTDGARFLCGFQKLEGHATPQGLWLQSTKPGGGQLRLVAVAVGREASGACPHPLTEAASSVRSGMSIVTVPQVEQAPLGATCTYWAASLSDMPLLTELETAFSGVPFYKHVAPDGAIASRWQGVQTLARTGKVSVHDKLVQFTRPSVTEEYSVSVDGVRQDFIIESSPLAPRSSPLNPSAGDLRVELALSGARAEATASGARLTLVGSGRALAYSRLRVEDATGRALTARLEVLSPARLAVTVADANATYPVRIDPTFSDADWVSLNPGLPGANGTVRAIAVDGSGNVYAGGDFTFIGTVPANYIAKWDGNAWSALGSGLGGKVYALAVSGTNLYAGGYFAAAGGVTVNNVAKWDGSTWSAMGSGLDSYSSVPPCVYALAVSGSNLYAGGYFLTAGGLEATGIAKWDGSAWSPLGSGMNSSVLALAASGTDLYAGGYFTTAGGVAATNIAKWNGSRWSPLGSGLSGDSFGVQALAVSGTVLYAGGFFPTAGSFPPTYIAKWDGSAWSALGSGINGNVYALTADEGGDLFVGGTFTTVGGVTVNGIAKWDGSTWSALGSVTNGWAYALAVSGTNLFVGGSVATATGMAADYIAKWDGSAWSALSSGMVGIDGSVSAVAVSGTVLYAGGQFTTAGGRPANHIAKWDGSGWSALGSGVDSYVGALAVDGTNLYAGGSFTMAGGVPANCIAKWDGRAWSALGAGMNYAVLALAVSGTNLYAGGDFTTAGGVPASNIAEWDGHAWSALHSGVNNTVLALAVSGTSLYAGGQFTLAGGVSANYIAKWHDSTWSALGSGISGNVYALAVSGAILYAGGSFSTVAQWNGSAWSALGSGISGYVYALAVSGTDLYAGGFFNTAGGVPANCVAKWDGSTWSALGSGISGGPPNTATAVNALAADGVGHLFVGGNFSLAGTNGSPYVAQADLGSAPTNVPPVIVASPTSLVVASGTTADFQVVAIGSLPLVYQWLFNGTNAIAGATSAILSLTNVQLTQAGAYSVTVSNLYGAVTSAPALLQVFPRGIVATNSETALRAVMAPGGTVTFACDGTITLASTIAVVNDTTLDGSGHQVTISGNSAVRVFSIATNVHFSVGNLTIADGTSLGGSAILNLGGTVNLNGVTVRSNTAVINWSADPLSPKGGGAIFNRGGTVNASNCSFARNAAYIPDGSVSGGYLVCGGAIRNEAGLLALRSCTLVGNQALVYQDTRAHTVRGGAIHNSGTATLDLCTLAGNSATGGASGVVIGGPGLPGGEGSGGAIYNEGTLTTDRTTLCSNTATGGAGSPGCWSIWSGYIGDAFAGGPGANGLGAAICNLGSLSVSGSTLASNVVTGGSAGSGGYGEFSGYADSPNGANGGNGGSGLGGALHNSGAASLVNCTIAHNTGNGRPGGSGGSSQMPSYPRYHQGAGGNGADGGSGFGGVDGTCNLINCTLASNLGIAGLGGEGGGGNPAGTPGVSGTAWGGTTCSALPNTLIASNTPPGGDTFPDPKLGPLADNGGPTLTMALLPGSPAIDAGDTSLAPATDQRGFPRPAGLAADIGAFEYGSVVPGSSLVSTLPATAVSTNSATLNGTVNPNGWPTTAWFQWGASTSYGNLTSLTNLGSATNALALSAALAGLAPGVTYHFRVAVRNDYGLVYGSDQSFTTLGPPLVSTLPATAVSTNSATLNGTVNPNGWPTTAWFQWGASTSYGNLTSLTNLGSATNALPLSAALAGLAPGVTYHFRVAARNDYGLGYGGDQSFTPESLEAQSLPNPLILTSGPSFGVQSNAFSFIISWATNLPVVVEACTNLANHSWSPVQTNALSGGWSYFSDPQWTNYPARFYRVRWP